MASVTNFLKENRVEVEPKKVFITNKFIDENGDPILWEIRPIGSDEEKKIADSVITEKRDRSTGTITQFRDDSEYMARIAAQGVVFPDLGDRELQKSYGKEVTTKVAVLRKMLSVGELVKLAEEVIEISGLNMESVTVSEMESDIDYAKN